ncbi:uncharacterized protein LOC110851714 isoform X2 [Folsomia candida]|nr:uncharacterized protein LOC110851714 isoform X2 [Folsomia candida]
MHPSLYKKFGYNRNRKPPPEPITTGRGRREPLSSEDTDATELDVFLSSCESNGGSCFVDNLMSHPIKETSFESIRASARNRRNDSSSSNSDHQRKGGFSQKFGQFFWKSKSKHSLGSESHVSGSSTIDESNGPNSPRFTPDSSLSIYTNSCEGDRHSSNSSSNSNQISPKDGDEEGEGRSTDKLNGRTAPSLLFAEEERERASLYRFDDCERYAANMYYNMGENYTTCRVQQSSSRPRNNSVPVAATTHQSSKAADGGGIIRDNPNEIHDYYMNPTFSTFPNARRHSVAYSSATSSSDNVGKAKQTGRGKAKKYCQIIDIEHDKDGYLKPLRPNEPRNSRNVYYINEPQSPAESGRKVHQVHVDVHSPTLTSASSSLSYDTTEFEALNSSSRNHIRRDFETSATTEDSQSTLLAGSICSGSYVPFYQNGAGSSLSFEANGSKCQADNEGKNNNNNEKIGSGSKFAPVCLSRIRRVIGSDCEPYCSLCGLASTMIASTFKPTMDVAIVSCHECFFSKNAESHIRGFLDKLVTPDKQKMDVKLQSYDMKDLEHSKVAADVHRSKVQIVIISHHFLQRLKIEESSRVRVSPVNRVFRSKRVIAILAGGVNHQEISDGYQMVLARFGEWFPVELRSTCKLDLEFSKKFTDHFVKIYNLEQCNTNNFTVFPKKVTRDQPKIIIILKKPLDSGDDVRVEFSCGRRTEGSTFIKIENPYTLSVRLPDSLCPEKVAYVEISVYLSNQKLGATCIKSDMQARICDDDVVEKMTKMVPGFLKLFDEHIKQTLIKNYRECTDYLTDPAIELMNDVLICKGDEFPTIMHFAAFYGLEHTAFTVLDEADGLEQCKILNDNEMKPLDLAEYRSNDNVVQIIMDYHVHQEISASYKAYQIMKNIYSRDSVLELRKKEIVSKSRQADKPKISLPEYENLPETAILDESNTEAETQENNASLSPAIISDDQKSVSSGGSYISWNFNQNPAESEATDQPKPQTPQKPKPVARSHRSKLKKPYVNVADEILNDGKAQVEAVSQDEVRLRHPRENRRPSRDHLRRKSISPIQNYDIPRFSNEEYAIPPPDSRPVLPEKSKTDNSPVLVKKTTGSIPITNDGYLIMDHEEQNGEIVLKEHLRYQEGTFVSISHTPKNDQVQQPAGVVQHSNSFDTAPISPPQGAKTPPNNSNTSPIKNEERKNSLTIEPNIMLDPVDEELIHLMKDFTNAGYSISQIELLFENWKCRPDVQKSIEDKKSYMKKVREEYKRLQSTQTTKGASILDKIKVVLTGKKKTSVTSSPKFEHLGGVKFSTDDIQRLQSRPSADRESLGSHGSGSGTSVPDSGFGVSELDLEREHDNNKDLGGSSSGGGYDSSSPKIYRNPLDRRFIPSYVPREPPPGSATDSPGGDADYQVPPPPRPLNSPKVPQKPARAGVVPGSQTNESSSNDAPQPPAIPQKPSHLKGAVEDDSENPPPPPPRTYCKPNPFAYIDYSSRGTRGGTTTNKSVVRSPSPYDNLKEDKNE